MNKLNSELRDNAVKHGLCHQWQNSWMRSKTDQELIEMFLRGLDFCIEHDYPSNDYILANFSRSLLNENKIFVSEKDINAEMGSGKYVIQGDSCGIVNLMDYDAATIHIRHNSSVRISVKGFAKAFIHIYDDANAEIEKDGESTFVKVYKH